MEQDKTVIRLKRMKIVPAKEPKTLQITDEILVIVSKRTNIPLEYLIRLNKLGMLKDEGILRLWNKALNRQGITRRIKW